MDARSLIVILLGITLTVNGLKLPLHKTPEETPVETPKAADENTFKSPPFCNGLDCPVFIVLETAADYEVRAYEDFMWSSTDILGMDLDEASGEGFDRLFQYISGHNKANEKIPMTAPVATKVVLGQGPTCESTFTVSFFVPFNYQPTPPQPSAINVYTSIMSNHKAYVRSFDGYANSAEYMHAAENLAKAIANNGIMFNQQFFYTAGYDSPFKPFNRHNEVWFFANEQ